MVVGGLDLAALEKNPSGACIGRECRTLKRDEEIIEFLKRVELAAVDAPLTMETPYRDGERHLLAQGFRPLPLSLPSMQKLHERAVRLMKFINFIETFVQPMRVPVVNALARKMGWNRHERDAFLCYLAAKAYVEGRAQVFGRRHPIYVAPAWYVRREVIKLLEEAEGGKNQRP